MLTSNVVDTSVPGSARDARSQIALLFPLLLPLLLLRRTTTPNDTLTHFFISCE